MMHAACVRGQAFVSPPAPVRTTLLHAARAAGELARRTNSEYGGSGGGGGNGVVRSCPSRSKPSQMDQDPPSPSEHLYVTTEGSTGCGSCIWRALISFHQSSVRSVLAASLRDANTRQPTFVAIFVLAVAVLQLVVGYAVSSLTLQAAAYRLSFDAFALYTAVVNQLSARQSSSNVFSYGYERLYPLLWFGNAVLLLFEALFMLEGVSEGLILGCELDTNVSMFIVGLMGLGASISVFILHGNSLTYSGARAEGILGSALNTSIWTSSFVVLSWWASLHRNGDMLDVFLACASVALMAVVGYPIALASGRLLLQATPTAQKGRLDKCLREASAFEGVLECTKAQFWELSPGVTIGSLHFRVRATADQQAVLLHVRRCFATQPPVVSQLTVQIDCETWTGH